MNHLLYNISVLMLLSGVIILTFYLSKTYNNTSHEKQNNCSINDNNEINNLQDAYTVRPSQVYDKMFTKPSIWQGYELL
jgi:hypothetical protein